MDFLKKFAGGKEKKEGKVDGQKEDYVDKAFAFVNKKGGFGLSKDIQEKITDGGRQAYEKSTGKKIDPKISN